MFWYKTNYRDISEGPVSQKISPCPRSLTRSCRGCEKQLKVPPVSIFCRSALLRNWKPLSIGSGVGPHLQLIFHTDAPKDLEWDKTPTFYTPDFFFSHWSSANQLYDLLSECGGVFNKHFIAADVDACVNTCESFIRSSLQTHFNLPAWDRPMCHWQLKVFS